MTWVLSWVRIPPRKSHWDKDLGTSSLLGGDPRKHCEEAERRDREGAEANRPFHCRQLGCKPAGHLWESVLSCGGTNIISSSPPDLLPPWLISVCIKQYESHFSEWVRTALPIICKIPMAGSGCLAWFEHIGMKPKHDLHLHVKLSWPLHHIRGGCHTTNLCSSFLVMCYLLLLRDAGQEHRRSVWKTLTCLCGKAGSKTITSCMTHASLMVNWTSAFFKDSSFIFLSPQTMFNNVLCPCFLTRKKKEWLVSTSLGVKSVSCIPKFILWFLPLNHLRFVTSCHQQTIEIQTYVNVTLSRKQQCDPNEKGSA